MSIRVEFISKGKVVESKLLAGSSLARPLRIAIVPEALRGTIDEITVQVVQ